MAHFAKLGIDNKVIAVFVMDNITTMTNGGIEKEDIGIAHLIKHHGHESWKRCSYNTHAGVHAGGAKGGSHRPVVVFRVCEFIKSPSESEGLGL